jgi:hypothetical protein
VLRGSRIIGGIPTRSAISSIGLLGGERGRDGKERSDQIRFSFSSFFVCHSSIPRKDVICPFLVRALNVQIPSYNATQIGSPSRQSWKAPSVLLYRRLPYTVGYVRRELLLPTSNNHGRQQHPPHLSFLIRLYPTPVYTTLLAVDSNPPLPLPSTYNFLFSFRINHQ